MKFGAIPSSDATGGILAHTITVNGRKWKKGRALTADDCRALAAAGIGSVVVAMPAADDLTEDDAARQVAAAFHGDGIRHAAPFTGRVNLFAERDGLLCYPADAVHALNSINPHITAATLPPHTPVRRGDLLATIKIIPFAVAQTLVDAAAAPLPFAVRPFTRRRVALLQTAHDSAPAASTAPADKTRRVTDARLAAYGAHICAEERTAHDSAAIAAAITALQTAHAPDLLLIAGAQAVSDENDTVPAAITAAGGELIRVGMPVDPGNLLLLARLGDTPVIGMPGCAKSPKANGFDWVLNRTLADVPLGSDDITRLGVGGLLADTSERPQPRQEKEDSKTAPPQNIAALLLAAGAARRMGGDNKLLRQWRGAPLIRHAAQTIAAAQQQRLITSAVAITGRDGDDVAALLPPAFTRAHNPHFESGMASSLACGIRALPDDCDAALIFLADMPRVSVADIAALTTALPAAPDADIIVPQHRGKRGNPVLLTRRLFSRLLHLHGDAGARTLFDSATVATTDASDGVLFDVDTPAAFEQAGQEQQQQ